MQRIHIDTDIGGDIDDLCALAMVLEWPDAELVGVTTVSDDGGKRAGYARHALNLANRSDIPVAAGADISLGFYRGRPGFPDESKYWPEPVRAAPGPLDDALALLQQSVERGAVIVAIGPFTNLSLLERRSPGILRSANLCLMGGFVHPPREGYPQRDGNSDYNIQVDAQSAFHVLGRSTPTLVPLSITVETWLRRSYLPALEAAGPLARLIAKQARAYAIDEKKEERYGQLCAHLPDDTINFQHDPLACAIALGWSEGVEIREVPLKAEMENGFLRERIDSTGNPTKVVTQVDGAAFSDFWLRAVTHGPTQ
jgi:inosine-uridine nucleoside N-ribohydrolase